MSWCFVRLASRLIRDLDPLLRSILYVVYEQAVGFMSVVRTGFQCIPNCVNIIPTATSTGNGSRSKDKAHGLYPVALVRFSRLPTANIFTSSHVEDSQMSS